MIAAIYARRSQKQNGLGYSPYSMQSAGFYWKCARCGEETDTDKKPASIRSE